VGFERTASPGKPREASFLAPLAAGFWVRAAKELRKVRCCRDSRIQEAVFKQQISFWQAQDERVCKISVSRMIDLRGGRDVQTAPRQRICGYCGCSWSVGKDGQLLCLNPESPHAYDIVPVGLTCPEQNPNPNPP
jgi:hypothetical protein